MTSRRSPLMEVPTNLEEGGSTVEPLALLGLLAIIVGILGVIVLLKGRKKGR